MKKLVLASLISGAVFAGLAGNAFAAADQTSGTIHFKGKVVKQSCIVSDTTKDQTIVLDSVSTQHLANQGETAVKTPFIIALAGCGTGQDDAPTVKARFSSIANVEPGSYTLKNTSTNNPATNVSIQLFNEDGTKAIKPMNVSVVTDAQNPTRYVQSSDDQTDFKNITDNMILHYVAAYYAKGQATPGNVESSVDFELAYE